MVNRMDVAQCQILAHPMGEEQGKGTPGGFLVEGQSGSCHHEHSMDCHPIFGLDSVHKPVAGSWSLLCRFVLLSLVVLPLAPAVRGQVVINELMYHPVEEPAFTLDGQPVFNLAEDIHEYVELHNAGPLPISLAGWRFDGGIQYTFANGVNIPAGGYLVVAKDPARLAAISEYGLTLDSLLGPYTGQLSNNGETVQLKNAAGQIVDAVSYSESFPWPACADALGASIRWTQIDPMLYQYRGRFALRCRDKA